MNLYTEKQRARKARLAERADKAQAESDASYAKSRALVEHIPLGQPILVGHHSERRHRKAIESSERAMRKSAEAQKKADTLRRRAEAVGKGGVSSDDPEAVQKLEKRLQQCREAQELMKAVNRQFAKGGWGAVTCMEPEQVAKLREHHESLPVGNKPFPSYSLQNNNAEIRRLQKRIEDLKAAQAHEPEQQEYEGFTYELCPDDNRVRFYFDGKPSREVCQYMRSQGFKFSRRYMAWQRQATRAGINTAKYIIEPLASMLKNA